MNRLNDIYIMSTHNLKPLSEVMKDLKKQGFTKDFSFRDNHLISMDDKKTYDHQDLAIIDQFRFEGDSDPGMMAILYALEAKDGARGTISNAYGANADYDLGDFMKKVKEVNKD